MHISNLLQKLAAEEKTHSLNMQALDAVKEHQMLLDKQLRKQMSNLNHKVDLIVEEKETKLRAKKRQEVKQQLFEEYKFRKELEKRNLRQKIEHLKEEAARLGVPVKDRNQPEYKYDKSLASRSPEEIERERQATIEQANKAIEANRASKPSSVHGSKSPQEGDRDVEERQSRASQAAVDKDLQQYERSPSQHTQSNLQDRDEADPSVRSNRQSQASIRSKAPSSSKMKRREEIDRELSELYKQEDKLDLSMSKRSSRKMDYSDTANEFDFEAEKQLMKQHQHPGQNEQTPEKVKEHLRPDLHKDQTPVQLAETAQPETEGKKSNEKDNLKAGQASLTADRKPLDQSPKSPEQLTKPQVEPKQSDAPSKTGSDKNKLEEEKARMNRDLDFLADPFPTEATAPKGPAFLKTGQIKPGVINSANSNPKPKPAVGFDIEEVKTKKDAFGADQSVIAKNKPSDHEDDPFASNDNDSKKRAATKPEPSIMKQPDQPKTVKTNKQATTSDLENDFNSFDNNSSLKKDQKKASKETDPFGFESPKEAKNKPIVVKEAKREDDEDDIFKDIGKSDSKPLPSQPTKPAEATDSKMEEPKFKIEVEPEDDF